MRWSVVGASDFSADFTSGFIKVEFKDNGMGKALAQGNAKVRRMVDLHMQYWAPRAEAYMKNNAPWTDQTGNARNGLAARAFRDGDNAGIVLYHQVPYGIWLEVKNDGEYAIIVPTIETVGPEVMEDLRGKLARIGFTT